VGSGLGSGSGSDSTTGEDNEELGQFLGTGFTSFTLRFLHLFSFEGKQSVHILLALTHPHPEQVPLRLHLQQGMIG
jgi:hypothetical protein